MGRGVGFRFRPDDASLIAVLDRLVSSKANGLKFDLDDHTEYPGDLSEMVMYGPDAEPWKIFSGDHEIVELHQTSDSERKVREKYVVAKLNRIGGKNFSRAAGAGCWLDKSTKIPVYVGSREVGHWRTLTYEYSGSDGGADGKLYYLMNELHLAKRSDYVICRVMKNLSKGCRVKMGTKRLRQDEDDKDCSFPVAKRSRREEESISCCSEVVNLLDETLEEDQECTSQLQESSPVCDDELLFDPDILSFIDEINQEQVPDMSGSLVCDDELLFDPDILSFIDEINQEQDAYVPDMSGLAQNEEEQEFFDFPKLQGDLVPSDDQWSFEELMNSMQQSCC